MRAYIAAAIKIFSTIQILLALPMASVTSDAMTPRNVKNLPPAALQGLLKLGSLSKNVTPIAAEDIKDAYKETVRALRYPFSSFAESRAMHSHQFFLLLDLLCCFQFVSVDRQGRQIASFTAKTVADHLSLNRVVAALQNCAEFGFNNNFFSSRCWLQCLERRNTRITHMYALHMYKRTHPRLSYPQARAPAQRSQPLCTHLAPASRDMQIKPASRGAER